jgi:acetylornithine deacetylase/succinyl-diaminopimelate desuccinylase-like protein
MTASHPVRAACAVLLLASTPLAAQLTPDRAHAWVDAHRWDAVQELATMASFHAMASDPAGLAQARAHLRERLQAHGFETRELTSTGVPAVFARKTAGEGRPTLLLYFHYDGQEVDPTKWSTDPFTPTVIDVDGVNLGDARRLPRGAKLGDDDRAYGRAIADDRGPLSAFLVALDLLEAEGAGIPFNVKVFMEGEEESSSPGLAAMLAKPESQRLLAADAVVIFDAPMYQSDDPTLYLGTRGIVTADLTVYGAKGPLHSGHYGNWAVNPAIELARLLASMFDTDGRVAVAGYYDDRTPLTSEEKAALDRLPRVEEQIQREFGIPVTYGGGMRLNELLTYPSLNVRGVQSMYVGDQARTVVPAEATAALDLRLVPGQSDDAALEKVRAHIQRQGYLVLDGPPTDADRAGGKPLASLVRRPGGYPSYRTPITNETVQRMMAIVTRADGKPPVVLPTIGGSGPLVLFQDVLGLPPVGVATYNHDSNQHSPNENIRLGDYFRAVRIIALTLATYGTTIS